MPIENDPMTRLHDIIHRMDEIRGSNPNYDRMSFLTSAVAANVPDEYIEKMVADYEQHIVKYDGEDSMLKN